MAVTDAGQLAAPAAEPGFTAGVRAWLRTAGQWLARPNRRAAAKDAGAPIGPAERVLTTGHDLAGSLVVATSAAIYFQDRGGPGRTWSRRGWEDVDAVRWHDRDQVLAFTGVHPGGMWRKELVLASRGALVDVARERVASTLLASTAVRLGDQPCARVTARRQPGSGKVVWTVVLNGAAGISNPAILASVEAAIAAVQVETGIPAAETGDLAWTWPILGAAGRAHQPPPRRRTPLLERARALEPGQLARLPVDAGGRSAHGQRQVRTVRSVKWGRYSSALAGPRSVRNREAPRCGRA